MVKNLFEKTVVESLLKLTDGQATADQFHMSLKGDIDEIKINVKDLCDRTTKIEQARAQEEAIKDAKIQSHSAYIKMLSFAFAGVTVVMTAITVFHII